MNCKNSKKSIKAINKMAGISQADIVKTKILMQFFLGLMDDVLMDKDFCHLRGEKYACVENLILQQGRYFEIDQEKISCKDPFKTSIDLALQNHLGFCEGFVLPYRGGIPVSHGWVYYQVRNKIISSKIGLHYGIAFNPDFALRRFQETGIASIFDSDSRCQTPILDQGFPKDSLFKK
jgi:hypothetical protein